MITLNGHQLHYIEHMLHYSNLPNVLTAGLLSHNEVYARKLITTDISMIEVQNIRAKRKFRCGQRILSLHEFVSFYFNSRNPMLYKRKELQEEILILLVDINIIDTDINANNFAVFSDGNAGSAKTSVYTGLNKMSNLDTNLILGDSWNNDDEEIKKENRRKMCSEVLVYPNVPVSEIIKIVCPNRTMYNYVIALKKEGAFSMTTNHIEVEISRNYYF